MYYSFQDKDKLYLVMDLLTGGDLKYHICKKHWFTEKQLTAFYGLNIFKKLILISFNIFKKKFYYFLINLLKVYLRKI